MGEKEIDVTCPCCRALLRVDVGNARANVLRPPGSDPSVGRGKPDPAGWDAAHERVRGRTERAADQLEQELEREREKQRRLDELFDSTHRRLKERGEDG